MCVRACVCVRVRVRVRGRVRVCACACLQVYIFVCSSEQVSFSVSTLSIVKLTHLFQKPCAELLRVNTAELAWRPTTPGHVTAQVDTQAPNVKQVRL